MIVVVAQEGERLVAHEDALSIAFAPHMYREVTQRRRHVAGECIARLVVVIVSIDQRVGQSHDALQ